MSRAIPRVVSITAKARGLIFSVHLRWNSKSHGEIYLKENAFIQADHSPFRGQFQRAFLTRYRTFEHGSYRRVSRSPARVIRKLLHGQFSMHFPVRERYFHDRDTARKCPFDRQCNEGLGNEVAAALLSIVLRLIPAPADRHACVNS